MNFEIKVALRYFQKGGLQSALMVLGVAFGVTLYLFIASLIGGLQSTLIQKTIGSVSQVTVEAQEKDPVPLLQSASARDETFTSVQKYGAREARISNWQGLIAMLEQQPELTVVSPEVVGAGFANRGLQVQPITIIGVDPNRIVGIIDLKKDMTQGKLNLEGQNCVIGIKLADDLGVGLNDRIRITSSKQRVQTFTVQGIFDARINDVNERSFYVSLPQAQRLLDLVGYITEADTKVKEIFNADVLAAKFASDTGLKTESWMTGNKDLLSALQAQTASSIMIRVFTLLSVALGITSVLIVSVVQKSREIGILKSMGASTGSILKIFLIQGLLVGVMGALVGCLMGTLLIKALLLIPGSSGGGTTLFPAVLLPSYLAQAFVVSTLIGMLAGIGPARSASRLDPVEVIRYG